MNFVEKRKSFTGRIDIKNSMSILPFLILSTLVVKDLTFSKFLVRLIFNEICCIIHV